MEICCHHYSVCHCFQTFWVCYVFQEYVKEYLHSKFVCWTYLKLSNLSRTFWYIWHVYHLKWLIDKSPSSVTFFFIDSLIYLSRTMSSSLSSHEYCTLSNVNWIFSKREKFRWVCLRKIDMKSTTMLYLRWILSKILDLLIWVSLLIYLTKALSALNVQNLLQTED